jgi:hypothetical protein
MFKRNSCAAGGLNGMPQRGKLHMKTAIFAAALALAFAPIAAPSSAEAKGCLKGALAGGVAGHYAGHHAVLGAIGGCVVGHHLANRNKENPTASVQAQHPANKPNGY